MDQDKEIRLALKICGGDWQGIAFENIYSIYRICLRELPCSNKHLCLEVQSDTGLSERKANEKLRVLLHRNILKKGKDNLVFWYTQNNENGDGKHE